MKSWVLVYVEDFEGHIWVFAQKYKKKPLEERIKS
jgi:hypothetical protein